jgi:hypothetical protein
MRSATIDDHKREITIMSTVPSMDEVQVQPVAWKILLSVAAIQFLLHVLTNGNYGIFRDEYYYLACADRLAWRCFCR